MLLNCIVSYNHVLQTALFIISICNAKSVTIKKGIQIIEFLVRRACLFFEQFVIIITFACFYKYKVQTWI
jgi:hypothetical protein